MRPLRLRRQPSPFLVGSLVTLALTFLIASFGGGKPRLVAALDNRLTDTFFHWRGPVPTTGAVVLVDIDEASLRALGQWPWPRDVVARLVKAIQAAAPKVIGFDIVFPEPDRFSLAGCAEGGEVIDNDRLLGAAVGDGATVLGYVFQTGDDGIAAGAERPMPSAALHLAPPVRHFSEVALFTATRAILNVDAVAQGESEGFLNVFPDADGIVRQVPLLMAQDGIPYPALALEMARIGHGADAIVLHPASRRQGARHQLLGVEMGGRFFATDGHGQGVVNFRGPADSFQRLSAAAVLQGEHRQELAGKYVLIGTSAAGLKDLRATPFAGVVSGVEVQANVLDNLIAGDFLRHDALTEAGLIYTLVIAGGILLSALLAWAGPLSGGGGAFLLLAAIVWGDYHLFFLRQQLLGITFPLLATLTVFLTVTLYNYFLRDREKRFIQGAFGQFVAPEVVRQLLRNPGRLSLSGERKNLTVLFCDLRNFTSMAEGMDPERLGIFMNRYLTAMSGIIMAHRGMVDKFIGDAIMAVWGAPLDDPAHAAQAVRAALGMAARIEALQEEFRAEGLPAIALGIGINTGDMRLGNFGSDQRFDYTVIGDAVNLASRLEGLNKDYGTRILITEATRAALGSGFHCRLIDCVRVKGRQEAVRIYEPLGEGEDLLRQEAAVRFERAFSLYQERRFTEAAALLEALERDDPQPLYRLFLARIEELRHSPPPPEWDGSYRFASK